jgi:hypothetical protein
MYVQFARTIHTHRIQTKHAYVNISLLIQIKKLKFFFPNNLIFIGCNDVNCRTCPGNANVCTGCMNDNFLMNDTCHKPCPETYFGNLNTGYCQCKEII